MKPLIISSPLSLNREGRWGTTDDFATSFLHFPCSPLTSGTWRTPGLSLTLSFHLFLCLPCFLPPFTVPCKMVLARPDERETCPYHLLETKTCNLLDTETVSSHSFCQIEEAQMMFAYCTVSHISASSPPFQPPRAAACWRFEPQINKTQPAITGILTLTTPVASCRVKHTLQGPQCHDTGCILLLPSIPGATIFVVLWH